MNNKGFLIVAHGSRKKEANQQVFALTRKLSNYYNTDMFKPAFMELTSPTIEDGIKTLAQKEIEEIIVFPFFLFNGMHLSKDVPGLIRDALSALDKKISYKMLEPIGMHNHIFNIAQEMLYEEVMTQLSFKSVNPLRIEDMSMEKIDDYIEDHEIKTEERPVIKRVIHTTGDFDFLYNMVFNAEAVSRGRKALREKRIIYTDVTMVQAGINKKFGHDVQCILNEQDVITRAEKDGSTRAAAGIRSLKNKIDGSIIVIGNAPTALAALVDMVRDDGVKPALIVGIPVGFINAKESKNYLTTLRETPYITNRGHKGGSTVAAAIINALIKMEFM